MSKHPLSKKSSNNNVCKAPKEDIIEYLTGILNLQFNILQVNETRANTVIAINAGLIAAIVWLYQSYNGSDRGIVILLLISVILCVVSLFMELCFTIPRINAKIGNENNIRGSIGICKMCKEDYFNRIMELDTNEMIKQLSFQISGMARNNMRGTKYLVSGIVLLMMAVIPFTISLVMWLLNYVK